MILSRVYTVYVKSFKEGKVFMYSWLYKAMKVLTRIENNM